MLNRGIITTINSDDPAYFGGYLNQNYIDIATALNLTKKELAISAKNSFNASFISPQQKKHYCDRVDSVLFS